MLERRIHDQGEPRRPLSATRWLALALTALAVLVLGPPLAHLTSAALGDRDSFLPVPAGHADDASRLNATAIRERWPMPTTPGEAQRQLVALLERARRDNLPISFAGARHTLGGHSIAADGIVIDMLPFRDMSLSADGSVLSVQAGALWADVIPFLDRAGRSVAIMQSDNSFSVGGSLSVNVHGWQAKRPPIAASVKSFRLLLADGRTLHCSRDENAQLFALALGGYGMFGIILDAELWTVPNERYVVARYPIRSAQYVDAFRAYVDLDAAAQMAFGRLRVTRDKFLEHAVLTVYRSTADGAKPPPLGHPRLDALRRSIYRGSVGSDYGKTLRWHIEKSLGDRIGGGAVSRNQLLNESVTLYSNRDGTQTDILHEYFLPPDRLEQFLVAARVIVPRHQGDLLNVTLRDVRADPDTVLRYADQDMIALVMLFNQPRTANGERSMAKLTRELIQASLDAGGRYYLPYRAHATPEQFLQAYPQAAQFVRQKLAHDPERRFRNGFFEHYLLALADAASTPAGPALPTLDDR